MFRNPFIFWSGKVPIAIEPVGFTTQSSSSLRKANRFLIHFIIATGIKPIFFFLACNRPLTALVQGRQVILKSTNPVPFLFRHTS
jgi:hypothetical protein